MVSYPLEIQRCEMLANILNTIFILSITSMASAEVIVNALEGSFETVGGVYYFFGKEKVTWYDAFAKCRLVGGFLVSIGETSKAFALTNHLAAYQSEIKQWWLSGADLTRKGFFYWYGTGNAFTYSNINLMGAVNLVFSKNCVRFKYQNWDYVMQDWKCTKKSRYICEFEKPKTIIDGELEDENTPFEKVGEKFYYLSTNASSWHHAFLSCRSMGSNLVSIDGSSEMKELSDYLVSKVSLTKWWMSGAKFQRYRNFVWYGTGKEISYTNWSNFPSAELDKPNRCVQLLHEDSDYKMAGFPCNEELNYICEITKAT